MFVENNKFMLGKYAFLNVIFLFCVHSVFVCIHMALSLSYSPPFTARMDLMENITFFSALEKYEQTRKVKGNESDRIFRIMNVYVVPRIPGREIFLLMLPGTTATQHGYFSGSLG